MTIGESISLLRLRMGSKAQDDDSPYTDEALYHMIADAAAIVFHRYRERYFSISPLMYSTFAVELQMVGEDFVPCETIDRCMVLQTINNIPEPLMSRNAPILKVINNKKELPLYSPANKHDNLLKDEFSYEVVNNKIRIHGTKNLKVITLKTVAADISKWWDIQYCGATNIECLDLNDTSFPLLSDAKFSGMVKMNLGKNPCPLSTGSLSASANTSCCPCKLNVNLTS